MTTKLNPNSDNPTEPAVPALPPKYQTLPLGMDWRAPDYRLVRILNNPVPEPAQQFQPQAS